MEASWWEILTDRETGSCSDGHCIPSLLLTWGQTMVEVMKIIVPSFKMYMHAPLLGKEYLFTITKFIFLPQVSCLLLKNILPLEFLSCFILWFVPWWLSLWSVLWWPVWPGQRIFIYLTKHYFWVCLKMFKEEIIIWISRLSKADCPSQCGECGSHPNCWEPE